MRALFDIAVVRYLEVVGHQANYLSGYRPGTISRNGSVFLRNRRGLLAVVTSTGKVYDRIGGERLDDDLVGAAT